MSFVHRFPVGLCFGALVLAGSAAVPAVAQERKPVPNDSVRIFVAGCSKGYIFTTSGRADDQVAEPVVPDGTHLRLSGPKKLISAIKAREGVRLEVTGLIRKGQDVRGGVGIGFGGGRISGGPPVAASGGIPGGGGPLVIDVEGWRSIPGECVVR